MSNQITITGGAKVRNLEGVLTGTAGLVGVLPINVANGIPQLDSSGKILVSQLPNSVMEFKGVWNAATNTPTLANGTGNAGDVWLCNVAGTVNFGSGPIVFSVGDYAVYDGSAWNRSSGATGTVTSVAVTESSDALTITGSPITTSGTINIGFAGTSGQYVRGDGGLTTFPNVINSIGLTMPSAFNVANSPLTANGTLAVTGAGNANQYVRGDGALATFPTTGGGGSAVYYYLNGSVNASVTGYKQMANTAIVGTGTDFSLVGNGLIAEFLTDAGNPNRLLIPAGAWNFEMYFSMSSSGGNQKFYVDLFKYNGSTFTPIASTSTNPEEITGGTTTDLYLTSLAVPETTLLVTDRLAIRVYIIDNSVGRTTTLHTEDNHLCQITTTFAAGLSSLNGLTANTQYFATGTSGTDFNIVSVLDTHTFNLPTASSTKRGLLSSTDWSTFNSKQPALGYTAANDALVVHLAGVETITGQKSFSTPQFFNDFIDLSKGARFIKGGSPSSYFNTTVGVFSKNLLSIPTISFKDINGEANFNFDASTQTYTFPAATGTIALTSQLTSGTVTSVAALTLGTTGTDLSSTVANGTTTPVITLNVPTASATNRGALSSTDWTTFNGKQAALNGTGFVKASGTTISYDNSTYLTTSSASSTYLPLAGGTLTGNLSINADNGTFFIGRATGSYGMRIRQIVAGGAIAHDTKLSDNSTWQTYLYMGEGNTSGNAHMWLQPTAGNFYIGYATTVSPVYLLAVNGNSYFNGSVTAGQLRVGATNTIGWTSQGGFESVSDGNYKLYNEARNTYGNLTLGSVTANSSGTILNLDGTYGSGYYALGFGGVSNGYNRIFASNSTSDGIYIAASSGNGIAFRVNGGTTNNVFITSGGKTQIGTGADNGSQLQVFGTATFSNVVTINGSSLRSINNGYGLMHFNNSSFEKYIDTRYISSDNGFLIETGQNSGTVPYLALGTGDAEKMRITSGGEILIGKTSSDGAVSNGCEFRSTGLGYFTRTDGESLVINRKNSNGVQIQFRRDNSDIGNISSTTSLTSYNISSDYRLKEDFKDIKCIDKILSINIYDFKWKSDGTRMIGAIAHELQDIVSYAVTGKKDAEHEDGRINAQSVDYSKLVPIMIKAIQEQQAQIDELKKLINRIKKTYK